MKYYCPRCGNLLYTKRLGYYRRKAICALKICDLLPIEWTNKFKHEDGQPPGSLTTSKEIAEVRERFYNIVERWKRNDHPSRSN